MAMSYSQHVMLRNLDKMMTVRGFAPAENIEGSQSSALDRRIYDRVTKKSSTHAPATTHVYFILQSNEGRIGVKELRTIIDEALEHQPSNTMLITSHPLTLFALKEFMRGKLKFAEHWLAARFFHNPTEHRWYSPHRIIKKSQLPKSILVNQLPKIQANDIICRYIGAVRNNIIEIQRPHPNGFVYLQYRAVV